MREKAQKYDRGIPQSPASLASEIRFTSLDPLGYFAGACDILSIEAKSRIASRPLCFLPERALIAYASMLCVDANLADSLGTIERNRNDPRSMIRDEYKAKLRAGIERTFLEGMRQRLAGLLLRFGLFDSTFKSDSAYLKAAGLQYAANFPFDWWISVHQEVFQVMGDKRLAMGSYARDAFVYFLCMLEGSQRTKAVSRLEIVPSARDLRQSEFSRRLEAISGMDRLEDISDVFDENLLTIVRTRPRTYCLDSEIVAILVSYHAMHRAMQKLMRELFSSLTLLENQEDVSRAASPITPAASRLINIVESMYERFVSALHQSEALKTRCFSDPGQYAVLASELLRRRVPFESISQMYLQIFERMILSGVRRERIESANWLRNRPGIDQAAHLAWQNFVMGLS